MSSLSVALRPLEWNSRNWVPLKGMRRLPRVDPFRIGTWHLFLSLSPKSPPPHQIRHRSDHIRPSLSKMKQPRPNTTANRHEPSGFYVERRTRPSSLTRDARVHTASPSPRTSSTRRALGAQGFPRQPPRRARYNPSMVRTTQPRLPLAWATSGQQPTNAPRGPICSCARSPNVTATLEQWLCYSKVPMESHQHEQRAQTYRSQFQQP